MTISAIHTRRRFLSAAAALAGAGGFAGRGTTALTGAARRGGPVDLDGLQTAMTGQLLRPGDAAYESAAQPWNLALSARRPIAIAKVADRRDIAQCVRRAGGRGVPLAARSGGHSYAGFSTPDTGLVVDVSGLDTVTVRGDGTVVVGSGAQLIDVYSTLAAHGRALPGGTCSTVGIAGLTLGGGIGVLSRGFGLTCDHLKAATIVTADGSLRTVDANREADLFWALRGGGGGNAGIVTDFIFSTVPAPAPTIFRIVFPGAQTATVLAAWTAWQTTAPKNLTTTCSISGGAAPGNEITGTWLGSMSSLDRHLASLIDAVGVAPTRRGATQRTYLDAMQYFAGCADQPVASCHLDSTPGGTIPREEFHAASRMLSGPLDEEAAAQVLDAVKDQRDMVLLFDGLGGQVAAVRESETAFPHRAAIASVQIYSWNAANAPEVTQVQQVLKYLIGRGSYVNYINPSQGDWASSYWGSNRSRLRKIVAAYDPERIFDFPQSVLRT